MAEIQTVGVVFKKSGKDIKNQAEALYREVSEKLDEAMQQQQAAIASNSQAETIRLASVIQRLRREQRELEAYAKHVDPDSSHHLSKEELLLLKFV